MLFAEREHAKLVRKQKQSEFFRIFNGKRSIIVCW